MIIPFLSLGPLYPIGKPMLALESPKNSSTYIAGGLPVDFTATAPKAWDPTFFPGIHYVGEIHSVDVYLDGNLTIHDANDQVFLYSNGIFKIAYTPEESNSHVWHLTTLLNKTAPGTHTLNVTVVSDTYYSGSVFGDSSIKTSMASDGKPVYRYPIFVSDIVNFTVQQPEDQTNFLPSQTTLTTIPIVIVIAAVASILLVYFKKHRIGRNL